MESIKVIIVGSISESHMNRIHEAINNVNYLEKNKGFEIVNLKDSFGLEEHLKLNPPIDKTPPIVIIGDINTDHNLNKDELFNEFLKEQRSIETFPKKIDFELISKTTRNGKKKNTENIDNRPYWRKFDNRKKY